MNRRLLLPVGLAVVLALAGCGGTTREEDAGGLIETLQPVRLLAIAARIEVHHGDACRTEFAEQCFVARPGLVHLARGRDHDDVGGLAAGSLHEATQDAPVVLLVLRAADRNDPAARGAFGNSAWTHVGGGTPRV
jgi:hypothetical protein